MQIKDENWYTFVDAREDEGLSHDEAVQLLKSKKVSNKEIESIIEKYNKWTIETANEIE